MKKTLITALTAAMVLNSCSTYAVFAETADNFIIQNGELKRVVNMEEVLKLPDNITSISENAFIKDNEKTTKIIIPKTIKKLKTDAFSNLPNLKEVEIEEGVEEIGDYTFADCEKLETVKLPSTLTNIGEGAFSRCLSLREITLPKKITKLNGYTFNGCEILSKINFESKLEEFNPYDFEDTMWFENFKDSNGLYIYDGTLYTVDSDKTPAQLTIPSNVKKIGPNAFSFNHKIKSVTISDSVTSIEESAFYGCNNLLEVKLSKNLKSIGKSAFSGCDNLKKVEIPASLESIEQEAFNDNTELTGSGNNLNKIKTELKAHKDDDYYIYSEAYNKGWINQDGHKFYKNDNGELQKGWMDLNGKRYYFYNNGFLATGFIKLSDTAYYYGDPSTGELITGWKFVDNKWYYFNPTASNDKERGWMQTSWKNFGSNWYFFYSDGTMATGFINPYGDQYYYLDESSSSSIGIMKTGWQKINGYWYYFNKSSDGNEGLMAKGWRNIDGTWYYFYYGDGKMAANTWVDGYHVNSSGAWDR